MFFSKVQKDSWKPKYFIWCHFSMQLLREERRKA